MGGALPGATAKRRAFRCNLDQGDGRALRQRLLRLRRPDEHLDPRQTRFLGSAPPCGPPNVNQIFFSAASGKLFLGTQPQRATSRRESNALGTTRPRAADTPRDGAFAQGKEARGFRIPGASLVSAKRRGRRARAMAPDVGCRATAGETRDSRCPRSGTCGLRTRRGSFYSCWAHVDVRGAFTTRASFAAS